MYFIVALSEYYLARIKTDKMSLVIRLQFKNDVNHVMIESINL